MNKLIKPIVAIFAGLFLLGGTMVAQPAVPDAQSGATPAVVMPVPEGMPCHHPGLKPLDFAPHGICFLPEEQIFVIIDSIDCAVDILERCGDTMTRIGRYVTDNIVKRHDLKNIVRPRSVAVMDNKIVFLASSQKDSSYIAVLDLETVCANPGEEITPIAIVEFRCNAYAFEFDPMNRELVVVGKNPVGYDINILSYGQGLENISQAANFHYHVPKQSERISESDPVGVGLTAVAVCVVFLALVCICFIMKGYGAAIMKVQDRKKRKTAIKSGEDIPAKTSEVAGEVYAAIAAAIYMYDQDMHDEEDTVITIQKVERAWTPWNAKFYNMNKYFNNRR